MTGTILIVDDSAADRALLRTIFARAGHLVHEAANGQDALRQAAEVRPHIIILDVNLPDMSGLDVCRSIRAAAETSTVPVLMLTVRHDDTDVLAGMEAGADDYVVKDSAGAIILGRANRLIEFRQMCGLTMLNQQLAQVGRLLTGIVHEIRGPLAAIRGNAELLRLSAAPGVEDEQWIESILRASRLLQLRLDHLMAAVRNGPANIETIDVFPLVREAVDLFVKGLPASGRTIAVEVAPAPSETMARGDSGRIIQVLLNLLTNAHQALGRAQLAPGAGRVVLRVDARRDDGRSWIAIDVADNGPGVPDAHIGRIFEPFFTTREEGTGYGLYLSSVVLKEQFGRITVHNGPEGGATFTVWLPAAVSEGAAAVSEGAAAAPRPAASRAAELPVE